MNLGLVAKPSLGRTPLAGVEEFEWNGQKWLLYTGFNEARQLREIFVSGFGENYHYQELFNGACELVALLIEAGRPIDEIASSLKMSADTRHEGSADEHPPEPLLRVVLDIAAKAERAQRDRALGRADMQLPN